MHIRSDNGPEFIAIQLRRWLKHLTVTPLYPWQLLLQPRSQSGLSSTTGVPTGFEGVCQDVLPSWGIPFRGMVEAA